MKRVLLVEILIIFFVGLIFINPNRIYAQDLQPWYNYVNGAASQYKARTAQLWNWRQNAIRNIQTWYNQQIRRPGINMAELNQMYQKEINKIDSQYAQGISTAQANLKTAQENFNREMRRTGQPNLQVPTINTPSSRLIKRRNDLGDPTITNPSTSNDCSGCPPCDSDKPISIRCSLCCL